jgi:hypothetical protein
MQPLAFLIERGVMDGQLRAAFPIVQMHGVGQGGLAAWIEDRGAEPELLLRA